MSSVQKQADLILIRHGQTAFNVQRRIQGHIDKPLDEHGLAQAGSLVDALSGIEIQAVYCSDLLRTRQTIEPYILSSGVAANYREDLRERNFGVIEGKTREDLISSDPDLAQRFTVRDPLDDFDGGESMHVLFDRCKKALLSIASEHPDETVVVVTHGGVLDCIYRWAKSISLDAPRSVNILNAAINRVYVSGEQCTIERWGDTAHLPNRSHDDASLG